ncbi:hypothetical protein [uncultured Methylobacterium sp.]|uniref:hypothetical protein n=1 Tax=uncultured Methylobacterium sp. TaxID=157278 RepID=UPI0035C9471D
MTVSPEALAAAGRLLLGEEWKRPMARMLGPHHPDGPRDSIDPRVIFRWAAGPHEDQRKGRPIPAWVGPALVRLLDEKADQLARDADAARALAARIQGEST